jgi:hypothetical protein
VRGQRTAADAAAAAAAVQSRVQGGAERSGLDQALAPRSPSNQQYGSHAGDATFGAGEVVPRAPWCPGLCLKHTHTHTHESEREREGERERAWFVGGSKRPVVESPWLRFPSECQRFCHPPPLNSTHSVTHSEIDYRWAAGGDAVGDGGVSQSEGQLAHLASLPGGVHVAFRPPPPLGAAMRRGVRANID